MLDQDPDQLQPNALATGKALFGGGDQHGHVDERDEPHSNEALGHGSSLGFRGRVIHRSGLLKGAAPHFFQIPPALISPKGKRP